MGSDTERTECFVPAVETLGGKLESFYIQLLAVQGATCIGANSSGDSRDSVQNVLNAMEQIARHRVLESEGETSVVKDEILKDAQRKTATVLRPVYVDAVNQLITTSTKRLRAKTALDGDATNHSQRHIHVLIDLFGTWSNIILEVVERQFAKENVQFILSSLCQRITALAFDSFVAFKQDKEVGRWCDHMLSFDDDFNILALDNLINQTTMVRSIVNQYYQFLFQMFAEQLYLLPPHLYANPILQALEGGSGMATADLLLVASDERMKWKEVDMIYTTLESGYLLHSTLSACRQPCLLELEQGVYVPQLVEDTVYLLNKVLERSLTLCEEQVVFMVGQRVLDVLAFNHLHSSRGRGASDLDGSGDNKVSVLCTVLMDKMLYRRCSSTETLHEQMLRHIVDRLTQTRIKTPPISSSSGSQKAKASALTTPVKSTSAPVSATSPATETDGEGWNVITQAASTWLTTWASPFTGTEGPAPSVPVSAGRPNGEEEAYVEEASRLTQGIATPMHSAPPTPAVVVSDANAALTMEDMLLQALDLDASQAAVPSARELARTARVFFEKQQAFFQKIDVFARPTIAWNGVHHLAPATATPDTDAPAPPPADLVSHLYSNLYSGKPSDSSSSIATLLFGNLDEDVDVLISENRDYLLSDADTTVFVNTLVAMCAAVKHFYDVYNIYAHTGTEDQDACRYVDQKYHTLHILCAEYTQCLREYERAVSVELQRWLSLLWFRHLQRPMHGFCCRSFEMSGSEMEDLWGQQLVITGLGQFLTAMRLRPLKYAPNDVLATGRSTVYSQIYNFFTAGPPSSGGGSGSGIGGLGAGGGDERQDKLVHLSEAAWYQFVLQLTRLVAKLLHEQCVLTQTFTEWGAMYFQQEVLQTVRYLQSFLAAAPAELVHAHHLACAKLLIVCNVLVVDKPVHVHSYNLESLTEDEVKAVLLRRKDFTKEMVSALRLSKRSQEFAKPQ